MEFLKINKRLFIVIGIFLFLFASGSAKAANVNDIVNFNVDKGFDINGRTQISATLIKVSPKLYFYIEKTWWESQTLAKKDQIYTSLNALSNEFNNNIYPKLTSIFGSEWNPGIDNDSRITVLLESMNSTEGGYFREADEYEKIQLPISNEKEMVYISLANINDNNVKSVLAHEFAHLITFNQKNKIFGEEDDTWLNEARADYSSTILGYDDKYEGSNLQGRVNDFIGNPSDSIVEWTGTKYDYASVSLFTHYLVDHYGINILGDSLKSRYTGIESLNYALQKNWITENFSQIFTNWTIASILNNCSISQKYCYLDQNLKNLRIVPALNFLPLAGNVSLSVSTVTKNWAGNWQKFIGGNGDLKLDFSSSKEFNFQVPYIIEDNAGGYTVKFLKLDANEQGIIDIPNFGTDAKSLIIIPSLQTKLSGFDGMEMAYPFSYTVKITKGATVDDQILIQKLLAQIESLKKQIADIIAQKQGGSGGQTVSCTQINNNLYFGISNIAQVRCLQEFLKNQGVNIYPEGLVTGNFGNLTRLAVIRFQEKYASEILAPVGLFSGSGYVGNLTRTKINSILNGG